MAGARTHENVPVLLVDDEPKVLEAHRRTLRGRFDVHTAPGGEAALEAMAARGPFTVVVSDFKMPDMDGITLLARVAELYPDTVRMILTGYADMDTAIRAVNTGAIFRFLTKPSEPDDLAMAIDAGIEHADMVRAARELEIVRRLKDGFEQSLRAFTRLVEFRDPYTSGHMDRTADIAVMIAERMGMADDDVAGLRLAAMVHDIGKVAVPSHLLNKLGELSDAEFTIIKAHAEVGAEIFKGLGVVWPIARMIREHHERLDGSGYPDGLTGDGLLLQSRILAVADVIDAIITHRPYRHGLGRGEAARYLLGGRDTLFDAEAVDIALTLMEEDHIREPGD
ncbi:response regulator receiver modulated metal dependent phosphohydrolase [Pseudodesulfovibrio mercurii]|uniref:Response regulator receiver modulated metal dependent phosphohydrolase n=1 Tax=Pseudodesulfovibrio mercurii TaxID=641491 RepID=F0JD86_9BACT|nr:HD domain-containing phosphohydrolase [Pseudodesulfovibrio mercurii]EGB15760.1 response regulator receiver modulated metal dependent phosphohydrolase [Pseudodesulfovibrio mercurii]